MMKFTYRYDESSSTLIEFTLPQDAGLIEVIGEFEKFLFASGYCFDGHLDFVDDELVTPTKDLPF